MKKLEHLISNKQLKALASIVQLGTAAYDELIEQYPSLSHSYFSDTRGRLYTKLVQMQSEIESHNLDFPFVFHQREFRYHQYIPELQSDNLILHIARSNSPDKLPYSSKYKIEFSNNNVPIMRQMIIDDSFNPPYIYEKFYALLVFGGKKEPFSVIQFPEPGFKGISDIIVIPQIVVSSKTPEFERKKAVLKNKFLQKEGVIS